MTDLMTETDLQRAVTDAAKVHGWLVYHTYDSRRSQAGFPDLVLVHPVRAQMLFVELKSAKGRLSQPQQEWLGSLTRTASHTGGRVRVRVWRPEDLDTALAELAGDDR